MRKVHFSVAATTLLTAVLAASRAPASVVTSVFGGKVSCAVQSGVQFCAGTVATRVETWDGVPLDVNVTLPPATMNGPFPLIVDIHGWGLQKTAQPFVQRGLDGYVTLSYTARGFWGSCGTPASRAPDPTLSDPNACTNRGWIRLADARYEARDTQYLAGLLADEGLVIPDKVGVTGASYGGGQSMILGALRDRVMLPDGSLVPWKSPGGQDMQIAAAAPIIPWSDLAYSLVPNGRMLDYLDLNPYGARAGVQKQSWVDLLYNLGNATGFYSAPGVDPDHDLQTWKARLDAGEPYDTNPLLQLVVREVTTHHSAYYIDDSEPPAPLFIHNAWTDDLFPADEALRFYLKTRFRYPSAEISLEFADTFGHPRANLAGDMTVINARIDDLFARHLKGSGGPLPPVIQTETQGCGGSSVMGAFTAPDWESIHPGEVRMTDALPRSFTSAGGNASNANAVNPTGAGTSCRTTSATDDPGAATYRLPAVAGTEYTLMGSPTVIATLAVDGPFAEIAARLWDVGPGNSQALISQSLYRPRTDGLEPEVFQLHPNGWHFVVGHQAKLELLGQSSPYGRPSNGTFTITVKNLELRLPVLEAPDGGVIQVPRPHMLPPPDAEAPDCSPVPVAGCRDGGGRLQIRTGAGHQKLVSKWNRGPGATSADFGDPLNATDYTLCVYNGNSLLLAHAGVPHGGTCVFAPCWTSGRSSFRYTDPQLTPDGVQRLLLKAGAAGKAKTSLRGKGPNLHLPTLPVNFYPVTAQLVNRNGTCWSTTFTNPTLDSTQGFSARR